MSRLSTRVRAIDVGSGARMTAVMLIAVAAAGVLAAHDAVDATTGAEALRHVSTALVR